MSSTPTRRTAPAGFARYVPALAATGAGFALMGPYMVTGVFTGLQLAGLAVIALAGPALWAADMSEEDA